MAAKREAALEERDRQRVAGLEERAELEAKTEAKLKANRAEFEAKIAAQAAALEERNQQQAALATVGEEELEARVLAHEQQCAALVSQRDTAGDVGASVGSSGVGASQREAEGGVLSVVLEQVNRPARALQTLRCWCLRQLCHQWCPHPWLGSVWVVGR